MNAGTCNILQIVIGFTTLGTIVNKDVLKIMFIINKEKMEIFFELRLFLVTFQFKFRLPRFFKRLSLVKMPPLGIEGATNGKLQLWLRHVWTTSLCLSYAYGR